MMAALTPISLKRSTFRNLVRGWDWLLLVAIAPVMLFLDERHIWVLLFVPLLIVAQGLAWGELLPVTPLNPAILLLTIMAGVSAVVTPDLVGSLGKIAGLLFGIAVYFCTAQHTRTKSGLRGSLVLFSLAGLGVALVGLVGTNWLTTKIIGLNDLITRLPIRFRGLPGAENGIHPYELAGALLWVIPVILLAGLALVIEPGWFINKDTKDKLRFRQFSAWASFLIVILLIDMGVLILTQSRGGYLAIFLTGLVLLVLIPKWPGRWWSIGLLMANGIGGLILILQYGWKTILNQVISSMPLDVTTFSLTSLNWRVEIWSRAIWVIKDVPLTGLGMNIFRSAVAMLYPTFQFSASYNLAHAHNELLQAALDLGLPGLVGFLALYVGALAMLVPAIRSGGAWRLLALGLMGGLLAHFVYGITDAVALGAKPGFLFWWLLGMVFGLYYQSRSVKVA
jgi:putative inorganic carbon (HCO3(-)) transporter